MRRPGAWALLGGAVSLLLAAALFDPRLFTGGDNAAYYALAEALATGRGYVDLITPGAPPESKYPPGFPLWLVPFWWVFGGSYVGVKLASFVAAAAALWATWALARRDAAVPAWAAAAAVPLVGLYPTFLDYSHWVLSEMTYLAVALAALWAFARATASEPEGERAPDRWTGAWLAGLALSTAAFYVRTAGIALIAAALLAAVLARSWRRAAAAAAIAVGAGPWILWTAAHPPPTGGYLEQLLAVDPYDPTSPTVSFAGLVGQVVVNVQIYSFDQIPRLVWPDAAPFAAALAIALVFGALLVFGAVRAIRSRRVQVWEWALGLSALLILVWPWTGDRFLLTVAPLLWLWALVGLDGAAVAFTRRRWPAIAVAGALAAVLAVGAVRRVPAQWEVTRAHMEGDALAGYSDFWTDYFEAASWIGRTAPDAVVLARKPTFSWYWSRRPSVVYPLRYDPPATWAFIQRQRVTHVLFDGLGSTRLFLVPALDEHLDQVGVVHSAPHRAVYVLRIEPAP
ncbi:MAG TPA: glycosyltransferase family 39 protein [Gemmatimonadota bacterium]|nr:glycosyltransferase family 39 protein [Gemmatimonadota bacterium]